MKVKRNDAGDYGAYGDTFAECVARVQSWSDNPEGFCNWVHVQVNGGPPGSEDHADEGIRYRCDKCDMMVPVTYGDGMPRYAPHTDAAGVTCDNSGLATHVPASVTVAKDDSKAKRVRRYDTSKLAGPVRLDNGWLRCEGQLSRIGIQVYRDGAGGQRRELRLPEEVFDEQSLASFAQVPLTNRHPPVMLDAKTATKYSVGAVGELRRNGDFTAAPILIYDAQAIEDAERGRSQLSNGYTCELDDAPEDPRLVEKWGHYDAIQRKIRGNHVALVDVARAGPDASLRLDAADAVSVEDAGSSTQIGEPKNPRVVSQKQEPTKMAKLKVDGFEFEVADPNAQSAVDRAIATAKKDAEVPVADLKRKLDEVQGKHDALEAQIKADAAKTVECDECAGSGKLDGAKCDNCDGTGKVSAKMDSAKIAASVARRVDRGVKTRAALLVQAQKILGDNEKLDGKSEREIRELVVVKIDGADAAAQMKGRGDEYVTARFDSALGRQPRPVDLVRAGLSAIQATAPAAAGGTQQPNARADRSDDPDEARRIMIERAQRANVKTGGGVK